MRINVQIISERIDSFTGKRGKVTQKVPDDFPASDKTSTRREYDPPPDWTSPGARPRPQAK